MTHSPSHQRHDDDNLAYFRKAKRLGGHPTSKDPYYAKKNADLLRRKAKPGWLVALVWLLPFILVFLLSGIWQ